MTLRISISLTDALVIGAVVILILLSVAMLIPQLVAIVALVAGSVWFLVRRSRRQG
jgi:hypothetical protein